jgi:hypothetical protein
MVTSATQPSQPTLPSLNVDDCYRTADSLAVHPRQNPIAKVDVYASQSNLFVECSRITQLSHLPDRVSGGDSDFLPLSIRAWYCRGLGGKSKD